MQKKTKENETNLRNGFSAFVLKTLYEATEDDWSGTSASCRQHKTHYSHRGDLSWFQCLWVMAWTQPIQWTTPHQPSELQPDCQHLGQSKNHREDCRRSTHHPPKREERSSSTKPVRFHKVPLDRNSELLWILSYIYGAINRSEWPIVSPVQCQFDTVDHDILLMQLHVTFRLSGSFLEWIGSLLHERSLSVVHSSTRSRWVPAPYAMAPSWVASPN